MEKFHYFLYGQEFTLETDQKPLLSIYKKHMIDISPRVQRLIVRSFPFLPFKVVYKKGVDIPVADALSHVTPMDPEDNIKLPIIAVNMITTRILMGVESQGSISSKLEWLRKSTSQDEQLTRLKHYISTGFPCDKKNLPTDLYEFWPHKEMLSIESGLITCGNRIIVPREMWPEMLQYIHEGHQGKERCLLRVRNTVFWAQDDLWHPATHREVYDLAGVWKISATQLLPGTPVWVQHRQNATWEPATVVNQCAPNSYWIMQENGAEQPNIYRHTRTMLKIRSTPTDGEQKAQMREWSTETQNVKSHIPAFFYVNRDCVIKNSQRYASSNSVQPPLPTLDLPESDFLEDRQESQIAESLCTNDTTLENAPDAPHTPYAPGTCKSTCENFKKPAKKYSDQLYL